MSGKGSSVQLRTRTQAILAVIVITAATVAVSLVLATIAIPLTHFTADWHHWFFATFFPLILTPIFCVPLVHANFRLAQMHAQLEKMAMTDSLTGLPNRRAFFHKVAGIFAVADALDLPVAVMMIDLDHFKKINDSYGHDVGDEVIHEVADSIRRAVGDCDACIEGFAARVGGDEFVVVLASKDRESVVDLARGIGAEVRRMAYVHSDGKIGTTVSIGVAVREPGEDIDIAMAAADEAAYTAKGGGRDRFAVADGDQSRRATRRRSRTRAA